MTTSTSAAQPPVETDHAAGEKTCAAEGAPERRVTAEGVVDVAVTGVLGVAGGAAALWFLAPICLVC